MRKRGFTLIELMIVIAIIAILASILVPNFLRARAQAQYNGCVGNIKNCAIAVEMYGSEYGDFPVTWTNGIAKLVPNYIKTWPKCPSSGTDLAYERADSWGNPDYGKDDYLIYCWGTAHQAVGITTSYRPRYWNRYGWYLK